MESAAPESSGHKISARMLAWTAGGVVVSAIGVAVAFGGNFSHASEGTVAGGSQDGHINGDNNVINNLQQFQNEVGPGAGDDAVKVAAASYAGTPPSGTGPWPFVVVDVRELGLMVRSSGERDGKQVGSSGDGATLWVDCLATTKFAPPSSGEGSTRWARVRWPNKEPKKDFFNSALTDIYVGWVSYPYLVPAGHNGQVPDC